MTRKNRKPFRSTSALRLLRLEDRTVPAFAAPSSYAAGIAPSGILSADFNNDGDTDVAVLNAGTSSVRVLLGNGDGTFQSAVTSGTAAGAEDLVAGDFNGDGKADLATRHDYAGSETTRFLAVMFGNGDGSFQPPIEHHLPLYAEAWLYYFTTGDVNTDGFDDLVAVQGTDAYPYFEIHALLGQANGAFTLVNSYCEFYLGQSPAQFVDVNEDGDLDLLAGDVVTTGNGDGTFNQQPLGWGLGRLADFTNDGHADFAHTDYRVGPYIQVRAGDGTGQFANAVGYYTGVTMGDILPGEFNGDNLNDILAPNSAPGVTVLLGNANGTIGPYFNLGTTGGLDSFVVGDFNGDGFDDFAAAAYSGGVVRVFLNDGNWTGGTMPPPPSITISDVTVTEGNSGAQSANFTVQMSWPSAQTITAQFLTANGSALAGSDFQSTGGTVTFTPGQTSQTIAIPVNGDRAPEATESFAVNLSSPMNATIADSQGLGTILDNEPRVSINDVSQYEGKNKATTQFVFTVTLSAAYDQAVTMSYKTANGTAAAGSDYTAKTGTLTFNPGETVKTITIFVTGDNKREGNETFFVQLYGLSSNAMFLDSLGVGTILNDD